MKQYLLAALLITAAQAQEEQELSCNNYEQSLSQIMGDSERFLFAALCDAVRKGVITQSQADEIFWSAIK